MRWIQRSAKFVFVLSFAVVVLLLLAGGEPTRTVPPGAITLELRGQATVVISPDPRGSLFDAGKQRVTHQKTVVVNGRDTFQLKGDVTFTVTDGDLVATVNNTTIVESPNKEWGTVVVSSDGAVRIGGLQTSRSYRITGAKLVVANEMVKATLIDCERIEVRGRADVTVTGGDTALVSNWGRLVSTKTRRVEVTQHGFASITDAEEVHAAGISRAEVTGCRTVVADESAKVKVSNCNRVEIRGQAEEVTSFISP